MAMAVNPIHALIVANAGKPPCKACPISPVPAC
jgi:hypothetical protein